MTIINFIQAHWDIITLVIVATAALVFAIFKGNGKLNLRQNRNHRRLVVGGDPLPCDIETDGAIHGTCIHINDPKRAGDLLGKRAFARAGRAVKGDLIEHLVLLFLD